MYNKLRAIWNILWGRGTIYGVDIRNLDFAVTDINARVLITGCTLMAQRLDEIEMRKLVAMAMKEGSWIGEKIATRLAELTAMEGA